MIAHQAKGESMECLTHVTKNPMCNLKGNINIQQKNKQINK